MYPWRDSIYCERTDACFDAFDRSVVHILMVTYLCQILKELLHATPALGGQFLFVIVGVACSCRPRIVAVHLLCYWTIQHGNAGPLYTSQQLLNDSDMRTRGMLMSWTVSEEVISVRIRCTRR